MGKNVKNLVKNPIKIGFSTYVKMEDIIPPRIAMRNVIDEPGIKQLAESIKELGLINPVNLMSVGDKYEIVAGNRRYEAHKLLGKAEIHAIIMEQNSEMYFRTMAAENYERQDISIIDEVGFIERLSLDLKMSQNQIAKYINKSPSYVNERMAVLDYPEALINAMIDGSITFSVAREFNKITDANVCETYLHYAIENGCTPAIARKWRKQWELSKDKPDADLTTIANNNWTESQQITSVKMKCAGCQDEFDVKELQTVYMCHTCRNSILST